MNAACRDLLGLDTRPDYFLRLAYERTSPYVVRDEQGQLLSVEEWPLLRVLKGEVLKGATAMDVMIRIGDGHDIQLNVSGAPVRDEEGHVGGAVMVMRDVTERRRLERRTHDVLNALLVMAETLILAPHAADRAEEPISDTPPAGSEVARRLAELTCNVLGCQRVGITAVDPGTDTLRGIAVVGLSSEQERRWWTEQQQQESRFSDGPDPSLVRRLRANEVVLLDMERSPWSSRPNPYGARTVLVAPMCVGQQLVGLLSLDYGGTEHEYTSEEIALAGAVAKLAALVIERERLLRERAEAQANVLAFQEANQRTDEFLGIASHELRTPLTSIKGNLQLAKRRLTSYLREVPAGSDTLRNGLEEVQVLLERAERQVGIQNRLVGDLVDISRIQAGKLELQMAPYDLATIVREAVEDQRYATSTRIIRLALADVEIVPVVVDAERIGQVVSNYLTNALKYSPEDRPVEVRLKKEGERARVEVADEGPGLSLEEQERIWERFYRAQEVKRQHGFGVGLGLGLHICRMIIEQHQGKVGVESKEGVGSTFWFTLPLAGWS